MHKSYQMKRLLTVIHIILLQALATNSFGNDFMNAYFRDNPFEEITYDMNGITICIDPRIEFYQVLNMIAGNPAINQTEMKYKHDIFLYFNGYQNHPSIEYFRNNYLKFFSSIDEPYNLILSVNSDLTMRNDLHDNHWPAHPEIDTLLRMMRTFAVETDFISFFNHQKALYDLLLQNTLYSLNDLNEKELICNFFGIDNHHDHKFYLGLNALGFGNFGVGISTQTTAEHYAILSPTSSNGSIPNFSRSETLSIIWHEFSHSFSNPIVKKHWGDFDELSVLYEPIKQTMSGQFYQDWQSVVFEHMVRAITCRLGAKKYSEDYARIVLERIELGKNFIYTIPIIRALKEFEKSRDKYPTFDSYMPVILKELATINQDSIVRWLALAQSTREPDIDNIPSIDEIYNRDNLLLILATNEKDAAADKRLKEFIARTQDGFTVIDDTTALNMDVSEYNLFVVGTPRGNRYLEEYLPLLPVEISHERLIAHDLYEGEGFGFISGWVNPSNQKNVMVIYTAQNPDDLVNFTWIPRGNTDYLVFKELITLKAADYKRFNGIWGCY